MRIARPSRFAPALVLVAAAALPACEAPPAACTELAAVSVTANVTDDAANAINDATVTFVVDGGAEQGCDFVGDGSYSCGFEIEGDFVITATKPGFDSATATATVVKDADDCHVVSESVNLVLTAQLDG